MKKFSFLFVLFLSLFQFNVDGQCWTSIAMAGGYTMGGHTLAIKSDGTLWAWGSNSSGQLGVGSTTNHTTPVQVGTANNWLKISAGNEFSAAIKSNGTLWLWGSNTYSQLGDGTTVYKTTPIQVGTSTWSDVYCGNNYVIAVKSDGTLWAWGSNGDNQLGAGLPLFQPYTTPHQISTTTGWLKIATGYRHVLALKSNGTLWYWGNNSNGQLGNNSTVQTPYITQLGTLTTWTDIAAGNDFSVALRSDGSMWTWGYNLYGQLGNGNNNASLVPIQVGAGSTWSNVEAGYSYVIAKKSNNTLWSFGQNSLGYLGLGNTTNYSVPTQIGTSATWQNIYVGYYSAIATQSNLNFYGWGRNSGQLGDGTTASKSSPTLMPYSCIVSDVDQDGYTVAQGDCNDNNASIHPGVIEICQNGFDDNCDGVYNNGQLYFQDMDFDGYAGDSTILACSQLSSYYLTSTDCNDSNPTIHPGALEVFSNSIDENCDGIIACEVAITSQPTDVFAPIGGIANFTLNISSTNSGVSYQWQTLFNGQWINLFNAGQYAGVNTPSLTVNNLNQNNYGKLFRCYLTSSQNAFCPTYSNSATIYGCDSFQQNFEITANQDTVCFGNSINLGVTGLVQNFDQIYDVIQYIPDDQTQCFSDSILVEGFNASQTIQSATDIDEFFINFEQSFMGDLVISFICPNGQSIIVHQQGGSNTFLGEPIDINGPADPPGIGYDYSWSPSATIGTWASNSGLGILPSGIYNSVQPFSNLVGCPYNGNWIIEICDVFASDDGWLFNWGLDFNNIAGSTYDTIVWQGNTLNWDDANGNANFSPTQYGPNEYSVLATLSNGCVLSDTISIEAVGPIISLVPEINTCSLPINLNPTVQGDADYVTWTSFNNPTVLSQYNTLSTTILQQPSTNTYELDVISYSSGLYCKDSTFVVVNFVDASILIQPNSVEANLGDIVYFSCIASTGATYQWQILVNGVWTNLFNAGQFSGVNTSQLSVSNVNLNNVNQQFQCVITSADGGCTDTSNIVSINFCDIASSSIPSVLNISLNSSPNIGITPITNGAAYQWQSNIGFGWMNISDGVNYQGTTTPNLQIINADWQNENEWLQCIVSTNLCSDTTNICVVHITPTGIDETEAGSIYYYENAIHFSKVSTALGQPYYVFDGSGKLISEGLYLGDQTIHLDLVSSGVYCFKLGDRIIKFAKVN